MAPLLSFNILTYSFNPVFIQPGQTLNLKPSPGFSAASYSISGILPAGLSFSTETGYFTGTATTLTPATTLQVTANLIAGGTSTCNVVISVVDIPVPALQANTNAAVARTDCVLLAEQNFLLDAEQIINNNSQLGLTSAHFDLGPYLSFRWIYFYFTRLNYTVENLNPCQDDYLFTGYFGNLPLDFPWDGPFGPWFDNYPDFSQPFPATVRSHPIRKVRISWSPFINGQLCTFPYIPFYGVS